jgi:hypothetical protein
MDQTLAEIDRKIRGLEAELSMFPQYKRLRELSDLKVKHVQHLDEVKRLLGDNPPPGTRPAPSAAVRHRKINRKKGVRSSIKTSPTALIIGMTERILDKNGKPMQLGALFEELNQSGITIGGEDPRANLSTKLSGAKDRIYNAKPHGWWLTARKSELLEKHEGLTNGLARPL